MSQTESAPQSQPTSPETPKAPSINVTQNVDDLTGGKITGVETHITAQPGATVIVNPQARVSSSSAPAQATAAMLLEPPYGLIWNRMKIGNVIPFLGAGASFVGRSAGAQWTPTQLAFLPSGGELAKFLAHEISYPSDDRNDLSKVSSYYVENSHRKALRERLRELLHHPVACGELHHRLAAVPAPQLIVTTNYDTLIEQAFRAANKPYDLVVYPTERKEFANAVLWWPHGALEPQAIAPNELDIDLGKTTVIYKMHGTLDPDTPKRDHFVITEEDYVEFLSRMTANSAIPAQFYEHCRERSFLFIGYSLADWNLRVLLRNLHKSLKQRLGDDDDDMPSSWAIQKDPTELDRVLWKNRRVNIFDSTGEAFAAKLAEWMK